MPFQLRISEGKEAGKEFTFDQPGVVIGRTPECDVCVYDAGVSRRHAKISMELDGFYVEDLNSSNGTRVNGNVVKRVKLSTGDSVTLGAVVFAFTAQEPSIESQHTRIVQVDMDATRPRAKVALLAGNASAEERDQLARTATTSMPQVSRTRSGAALPASRPAPAPLAARPPSPARGIAAVDRAPAARGLSAAEKARIRRESPGAAGALRIFWAEASGATRALVVTACTVVVLSALGGVAYAILRPTAVKKTGPEPSMLTAAPIEASFGLGDGVEFEEPDKKVFDFIYNAPVRAVVILHYQARDISAGEVEIFVNSASIGQVPADTLDVDTRQNELIIPPSALKKGETNKITFDSLKNPPGHEPWRIWNTYVETALVPDLPPDQLVRKATESFQRGELYMQRRDIGAENRYLAWKEFREAWLLLEGLPPGGKPELYLLAKDRVKTAQQELDRTCSKLLLEVEGEYNQKNWDAARATLEHVKEYFPTNLQACPSRADQKRYELGL